MPVPIYQIPRTNTSTRAYLFASLTVFWPQLTHATPDGSQLITYLHYAHILV